MLIVAVVANVTPGKRSLKGLSQTLLPEERQSSSCACDTGDRAHYNAMALPNASYAYKRSGRLGGPGLAEWVRDLKFKGLEEDRRRHRSGRSRGMLIGSVVSRIWPWK